MSLDGNNWVFNRKKLEPSQEVRNNPYAATWE